MAEYQNVNELIKDMIDGYKGSTTEPLSVSDFNGDLIESLEGDREIFWRKFLDFMKNEDNNLQHIPILESDFPTDVLSVFKFISDRSDLDTNEILSDLKAKFLQHGIDIDSDSGMANNSKDYFWNESLSRALAIFLNYFDADFNGGNVFGNMSADDIKNANAGLSFSGSPWVKPNTNVDSQTYDTVRGSDKIQSVLNNSNQLQFTRSQNSKWIRLLMPKYLRKVEVEDLNRNFWVISQALGAVCGYLFDDNAPFQDLFKSILSELIQLWENVLYLWATLAMLSQKKSITNIHMEVVPIPNDEWKSYIKFDDFERPTTGYDVRAGLEGLYSKLSYIIKQYSDSHVVIVPQIRSKNYKHNYYGEEFYPGFIFYDRNKEKVSYLPFLTENGNKKVDIDVQAGATTKYKNIVGALKEENLVYKYMFPISRLDGYFTEPYYVLLRTIPTISVSYDETEGIVIDNFRVYVYDVSRQIYGSGTRPILIEKFEKELNTESSNFEIWSSKQAEDNASVANYTANINYWIFSGTIPVGEQTSSPVDIPITQGYYAGEFPSYCYALLAPSYEINLQDVYLVPFVSYSLDILPALFESNTTTRETIVNTAIDKFRAANPDLAGPVDASGNGLRLAEIQDVNNSYNDDASILGIYAQQHDTSNEDERKFKLYVGYHHTTLHTYNGNVHNTWSYWQKNGANSIEEVGCVNFKANFHNYASDIGDRAVLYNPVRHSYSTYNGFSTHNTIPENWLDPINGYRVGSISRYTNTFLDDTVRIMNDSNWLVQYVEVTGGKQPVPRIKPYYYTKQKVDGYDVIASRIMFHIFGPDGSYGCKIYDRYEDISANMSLDTADLSKWKVSYINRATYEDFENKRSGLITLKSSGYDFEHYPNTGKAGLEEVHSTFI